MRSPADVAAKVAHAGGEVVSWYGASNMMRPRIVWTLARPASMAAISRSAAVAGGGSVVRMPGTPARTRTSRSAAATAAAPRRLARRRAPWRHRLLARVTRAVPLDVSAAPGVSASTASRRERSAGMKSSPREGTDTRSTASPMRWSRWSCCSLMASSPVRRRSGRTRLQPERRAQTRVGRGKP